MSRLGSSAASRRIFAQISLALSSRTSEPSQMMRSARSWSKMLLTNAGWAMCCAPFQLSLELESTGAPRANLVCSPWAESDSEYACRMSDQWDARVAAVWAAAPNLSDDEVLSQIDALAAERGE